MCASVVYLSTRTFRRAFRTPYGHFLEPVTVLDGNVLWPTSVAPTKSGPRRRGWGDGSFGPRSKMMSSCGHCAPCPWRTRSLSTREGRGLHNSIRSIGWCAIQFELISRMGNMARPFVKTAMGMYPYTFIKAG